MGLCDGFLREEECAPMTLTASSSSFLEGPACPPSRSSHTTTSSLGIPNRDGYVCQWILTGNSHGGIDIRGVQSSVVYIPNQEYT